MSDNITQERPPGSVWDKYEDNKEDAKQLLKTILPASAWLDFERYGYVTVRGKKWIYQIGPFTQTTILNPQTGKAVACSCIQVSKPTPAYNRMVGEYFLIKNHENLYLKVANVWLMYGWRRNLRDLTFWFLEEVLLPLILVFGIVILVINLLFKLV